MANIVFNLSNQSVSERPQTREYTFRDIGAGNIRLVQQPRTGKQYVYDKDTSNLDMAAIRQSLNNILNFRKGQRILQPQFGIQGLNDALYQTFQKYNAQTMISTIRNIIQKWEPRISITGTPTTYSQDKGQYYITIQYDVPELGVSDTYQFTLSK